MVSIGIALVTRNRPESLIRTLKSAAPQSAFFDEIIVSDDSDEDLASEVATIAKRFGARYVRGPRRGLYANRNHSANMCRTTHVRTMDDDHEFPEDHFRICRKAVESEPASCWMIGEFPDWETAARSTTVLPPGHLLPSGVSGPPTGDSYWGVADGAAMYPKALFDNGLRFFEPIRMGQAYLEFGSRLHSLGVRIRHLSQTYIIHHHEPRLFHDSCHELASRTFAALCHGLLYADSPSVRFWSVMYVLSYTIPFRGNLRAVWQGVQWYLARRREHREWLRVSGGTDTLHSRLSQIASGAGR